MKLIIIAKKKGREYYWLNRSEIWFKMQNNHRHSLDEFCRAKNWPDIGKIINNPTVQEGLKKNNRWRAYPDLNIYPQTALMHIFGLVFLSDDIFSQINGSMRWLDKELLFKAMIIHNIPKGLGCKDAPYQQKIVEQDLEEYKFFKKFIKGLAGQEALEKMYLLQFCGNGINRWPEETRQVMVKIQRKYFREIKWFKFLEALDFLIYAEHQYVHLNTVEILQEVTASQVPIINSLAKKLPELQAIWTEEAKKHFSGFIKQ